VTKRRDSDYYPTPKRLAEFGVDIALDHCERPRNEVKFFEPGCGPDIRFGSIAIEKGAMEVGCCDVNMIETPDSELLKYHPTSQTIRFQMCSEGDFTDPKNHFNFNWDIVAGNPPFYLAQKFVERSHELITERGVICFLLRLSFLESKTRIEFWRKYKPERVIVLSERPSFYEESGVGKTDGSSYAFFVWRGPGVYVGETKLEIRSWR